MMSNQERPSSCTSVKTSYVSVNIKENTNKSFQSLGIILIVISSITTSIVSVCAKYLADKNAPAFQVVFFRFIGQFLLSFILVLYSFFKKKQKKSTNPSLLNNVIKDDDISFFKYIGIKNNIDFIILFLNGIFYVGSATTYQLSLNTLNLADASVIYFTMPIWTAIFEYIFLKEILNCTQKIALILAFIGALMDARPSSIFGKKIGNTSESLDNGSNNILFGIIFAVLGSILGALYTVASKATKQYDSVVRTLYPGIIGCIVLPIITTCIKDWENPAISSLHFLSYLGCGLFTAISQITLNAGLKYESAGIASIIRTSDIIFNAIWSAVIFKNVDTWFSYIGVGIVIIATFIIGFDKYCKTKQPKTSE